MSGRAVRLDGFLRHDEGGEQFRAELAAAEGQRAKQQQAHCDASCKHFNPQKEKRGRFPWNFDHQRTTVGQVQTFMPGNAKEIRKMGVGYNYNLLRDFDDTGRDSQRADDTCMLVMAQRVLPRSNAAHATSAIPGPHMDSLPPSVLTGHMHLNGCYPGHICVDNLKDALHTGSVRIHENVVKGRDELVVAPGHHVCCIDPHCKPMWSMRCNGDEDLMCVLYRPRNASATSTSADYHWVSPTGRIDNESSDVKAHNYLVAAKAVKGTAGMMVIEAPGMSIGKGNFPHSFDHRRGCELEGHDAHETPEKKKRRASEAMDDRKRDARRTSAS